MRLLLNAQLSGRVVGRHLRSAGHDVVALDEQRSLEGIDDSTVLELAAREGRVLITHNVKDFPDILREWAEQDRHHAGCVLVVGIAFNEFRQIIDSVLAMTPSQPGWNDRAVFASGAD